MGRYYLIAGESSGDMHAANLMQEIRMLDPRASFRFWGGDRMLARGGELVVHIRELAFMGFWEVLMNLRSILAKMRFCKKDILENRPDVLVLVDYPGFNLRMARFAHEQRIPVAYYISPQVWAWKQSRVHTIKKVVDKMLLILPFEQSFYRKLGMEAHFVGHPLLDELAQVRRSGNFDDFREKNGLPHKPLVALLPGSRRQEIQRMLRGMTSLAPAYPEHHFVVAGVTGQDPSLYKPFTGHGNVSLVLGQTYELLANARAALVASGTATLETALMGVPQAVCYKANSLSVFIARQLVKVKYISLVNLIMDRPVLRELIQKDFSVKKMRSELDKLLFDASYRRQMTDAYRELEEILGGEGASGNAAAHIVSLASQASP